MKWIPNPLQRRRRNREIAEEVEAHIEEKIAELVESGMSDDEASPRDCGCTDFAPQSSCSHASCVIGITIGSCRPQAQTDLQVCEAAHR
jgi:hypothetical protein